MSAVGEVVTEVKRGSEELIEEGQKMEILEKLDIAEKHGIGEKRQATDCEDSETKKPKIEDVRQETLIVTFACSV